MITSIASPLEPLKNKALELITGIDEHTAITRCELNQDLFNLEEVIHRILAQDQWISQISARSYIHDNGFVKLVLDQENGPISETRMHIWPAIHSTLR